MQGSRVRLSIWAFFAHLTGFSAIYVLLQPDIFVRESDFLVDELIQTRHLPGHKVMIIGS